MVNLFPREVPRVLNLFPRELIESTPKDFPNANPKLHQRPDPHQGPRVWPKMQQRVCLRKILRGTLNLHPREHIEDSRNFPREQIHHNTPEAFQQIVAHLHPKLPLTS